MLRKLFNHALLVLTMYHHGKTVCLQRAVNGKRRSWSPDPWAYTVAPQKCRFATFSINILNVQEDQGSIELLIGSRLGTRRRYWHQQVAASPLQPLPFLPSTPVAFSHGLGDLGRDRAGDDPTIPGFRARGLVFGGDAIFDPDSCHDRGRYGIAM